jgi:hypothetical protein
MVLAYRREGERKEFEWERLVQMGAARERDKIRSRLGREKRIQGRLEER